MTRNSFRTVRRGPAAPARHNGPRWAWAALAALFLVSSGAGPAEAFGLNKLKTRSFEWRIFETEHFEIFYYPEEEALAREVCQDSEDAFQYDSRLLRYRPLDKTPLFIYRNSMDFQQTTILPSVVGVDVGGFTEAFKNRIALPATASRRTLRQVIRHEFVHAVQYDILYGEGMRSFRIYKGYLIPLWIMEGMAEFAAGDWDSQADMVVRDAVLSDRLIPLTLLDGFSHLEDVYLAYKESQLAMQFLSERYGEEKLAVLLKKFKAQVSISQILRETIGQGLAEFNHDFLYWVRQKYWVQANLRQPLETYGQPVAENPRGRLTLTAGPAWSPDGKYLAYISDADQTARVYLKRRGSTEAPAALTGGKFDLLPTQGSPLAWSPDSGRLAFAAVQEGRASLFLLTVANGALERRDLDLDNLISPAWSPQGDRIALVGMRNGTSDIYLWSPSDRTLTAVSTDRWADNAPAWTPDGKALVYSSERGVHWQLVLRPVGEPGAEQLLTQDPSDHLQPRFSADGRWLYSAGDRSGIFNLYRQAWPEGTARQVTDVRTGAFQPAPAPDDKALAFSAYAEGSQNVYVMTAEEVTAALANTPAAAVAPAIPPTPEPAVAANPYAQSPSEPYAFRFSPDLLFLLAGYDSSQGVVGGGYLTASDLLGEHLVSLISDIVPGYQASTQLTYANFSFPVDLGLTAAYQRNYYRYLNLETGTLVDQFNDQQVSGALSVGKAFSLFDRVDAQLSLSTLRRELTDQVLNLRRTTLQLALTHDDTAWWDFEPANGFRHQLTLTWADKILGGEETFSIVSLNAQGYQTLDFLSPNLVLGARLLAAASSGLDHPLLLFGGIGILPASGTLRGYPYGNLLGSQVAVGNLELRFPLARNVNYSLWPLDFLLLKDIQLVLFDDLGVVTNHFQELTSQDLRNSVGAGIRLHTFLLGKELLTLRFDISKITQNAADPYYTFGLGQAF